MSGIVGDTMNMDQDPSQVHLETGPPSDEEKLSALQTEDVAKVWYYFYWSWSSLQSPMFQIHYLCCLAGLDWPGL